MKTLLALMMLTQAQQIPQEVKKAEAKLAEKPDDPAANLVLGKYYLQAEPGKAMPYLLKVSDPSLKNAAAAEETATKGGLFALEAGDLWTQAMAKNKPVRQACLDRASFWYAKAWPDLGDLYKVKLTERLSRLYVPPVPAKGVFPPGMKVSDTFSTPGTKAHSGGNALRVSTVKKDEGLVDHGGFGFMIPKGKKLELSVWFLSDASNRPGDKLQVELRDSQRKTLVIKQLFVTPGMPVWTRVTAEAEIPNEATYLQVGILTDSTTGAIFIDDFSAKVDGVETFKGGSFE